MSDITVVGNAVSLDHYQEKSDLFDLPSGKFNLLYLTRYYPHKNIEVFLSLAELIRARNLPFNLVTTLEPEESPGASAFLLEVERRRLDSIIVNLGVIPMDKVPSLFASCSALLMPTLMESFSGTYVEAMFHQKVIFTSDLDFARDVCKEAAVYFDPMNPEDMLEKIVSAFESDDLLERKISLGRKRLQEMPSWPQAFDAYMQTIERAVSLGPSGNSCAAKL
jgi:glycosyltransferase involved in cell wall biosynthesis